jgi:hypothetical protein
VFYLDDQEIGVQTPAGKRNFTLITTSRLVLGSTPFLIQLISAALSSVVKRPEREADRSRVSSAIHSLIRLHGEILSTGNNLMLLVQPIIGVVNWRKLQVNWACNEEWENMKSMQRVGWRQWE